MQRVEMHIPSHLSFERVVRASADEIGQVLDLPTERIEDLKLAVSEAVCNAIEHGNRSHADKLVAVVFALNQEMLEVQIRDQGEGVDLAQLDFSPQRVEDQHVDEEEGRRGFGMFLIGALVDHFEVLPSQQGTLFILRLYRKGQAS